MSSKSKLFPFLVLWGFIAFGFSILNAQNPIQLEDIWVKYKFFPKMSEEFNWMKNDQFYTTLENNKLFKYDIKVENKKDLLVDFGKLKNPTSGEELEVKTYVFSPSEQNLLIITEKEKVYRHSTRDIAFVYNLSSEKLLPLNKGEKVMYASFSPDEKMLAFVSDNNLFYQTIESGEITTITKDGKWNNIINGATDWVYEEEFAFTKAFFWSPDNSKIAYYRFDESHVKEFSMPMYGELYPEHYTFKYPKAGEKNAFVDLYFFHLDNGEKVKMDLGTEKDQYIPRAKWTKSSDSFAAIRMNRLQNTAEVMLINPMDGSSKIILTEKEETYISQIDDENWTFLKNGSEFLWISERDGNRHLYLYGLDGTMKKQLTQGDWDLTELSGVDEENGNIYFLSTATSPVERHLYKTTLKGGKAKKMTKEEGWHSVSFSSNYNYFKDDFSVFGGVPKSYLKSNKGSISRTLEENVAFQEKIDKTGIRKPEFFNFKTSDQIDLTGWMIKPKDFDGSKKYPVLMYVYGGPGSQTVKNQFGWFNYFWFQMLANEGYIVVSVDGRGTGGRGEEFKKCTYADLGNLETVDQIEAAKYLGGLSYVNKDRIGIWGWSYGGYMTSLCLTKGADIFKTGIAVAPVTNWRFYDTIYTERYLKTPQLNEGGYDNNSPINFASDMKGNYLLVHGTADDNVHFQNSMEWVDALVKGNVQFDMAFYPNKAHGISGGVTRFHLYKKMTDFILEKL